MGIGGSLSSYEQVRDRTWEERCCDRKCMRTMTFRSGP